MRYTYISTKQRNTGNTTTHPLSHSIPNLLHTHSLSYILFNSSVNVFFVVVLQPYFACDSYGHMGLYSVTLGYISPVTVCVTWIYS